MNILLIIFLLFEIFIYDYKTGKETPCGSDDILVCINKVEMENKNDNNTGNV